MIIIGFWLSAIGFTAVLSVMSMMKCLLVLMTVLWVEGVRGYCPSLCSCKSSKSPDGAVAEPLAGDSLKLKCGGNPTQVTEFKEIDLSKLWMVVVSL